MFSKSAVRSRKTIIKGLLTRAFARSQEDGERMELLIEWRLAACRYSNRKSLRQFNDAYRISDIREIVPTGSRGLDAFNWISMLDGRNDILTDATFEKRIKDMEHMHHISRFFKNSEIIVDIEVLQKVSIRNEPNSPIIVDLPTMQLNQRNERDAVHMRETVEPAYMRPPEDQVKKNPRETVGASPGFVIALNRNKPTFH